MNDNLKAKHQIIWGIFVSNKQEKNFFYLIQFLYNNYNEFLMIKKESFDLDQSVRYDQPNVAPLIPKTHLSDVWILKAETKR